MQDYESFIMTYFVYWEGKRFAFAPIDMKDYYIETDNKIVFEGDIMECIEYCSRYNSYKNNKLT